MELKLVYRILRKISDWTLAGYYSEVYASGTENVPKEGSLIITPSHHNEIVDIATVAATIPYRRHVSFWAKSTMFVNPITRAILVSAGSIPVKRNPNGSAETSQTSGATITSNDIGHGGGTRPSPCNEELFKESFIALSKGQVLGVFPEGTSYTEPGMAQLMSGAAWTAVEYERWKRKQAISALLADGGREGLAIVPVAVVYTEKAKYRSRVVVRYGDPILLPSYSEELFNCLPEIAEGTSRSVVKKIMAEVERQLLAFTINAPDWDTIYAARISRDMLWARSQIPLKSFVQISQILVEELSTPRIIESPELTKVRETLVKYYSLLHYTKISHDALNDIYPPNSNNSLIPTPFVASIIMFRHLLKTIFHPRFILFLPALFLHRPAYICATLAARFLAKRDEEEGQAQFKAIFGGFGSGLAYGVVTWRLGRWLKALAGRSIHESSRAWMMVPSLYESIQRFDGWLKWGKGGFPGRRIIAMAALFYGTSWALVHWHNLLIDGNYKQFKRFIASLRLLRGAMSASSQLPTDQMDRYSRPPPPPFNPFIKRRQTIAQNGLDADVNPTRFSTPGASVSSGSSSPRDDRSAPSRRLIGSLLSARSKATNELARLWESMEESRREVLERNGASIYSIQPRPHPRLREAWEIQLTSTT